MPTPDYQSLLLPALKLCEDGEEHTPRGTAAGFADDLNLTEEDRQELLPSGSQTVLANRTNWALYYLFRAGLLNRPVRGKYSISGEGRKVLAGSPESLSTEDLKQYAAFRDFCESSSSSLTNSRDEKQTVDSGSTTPHERIEAAAKELNSALANELLDLMKQMDPFQFEKLVIDLLFAMGYGGSREEAATVTRRTNDGGIDGVINEDRLGLNVIYVQAKRWQGKVGRNEIQNFVGALAGKEANKGVIITTSDFGKSAREFAESVNQTIILIHGLRLADLMIEHDVGVAAQQTYRIKDVDRDYFEE